MQKTTNEITKVLSEYDYDRQNCSCGRGERLEQFDLHNIYCGRMCDTCFIEKYKQYDYEKEERDFYEG